MKTKLANREIVRRLIETKKVKGITVNQYVQTLISYSIDDREAEDIARFFSVLSDPVRIKILKILEKRIMCVCELKIALGLSQPTISYHLKLLRECGCIKPVKKGKWIFYKIANKKLVRSIFSLGKLLRF